MKNFDLNPKNDVNEDITDSYDLLHSHFYGVRQFVFQGGEDPFVGVVVEETDDSFLVAMPTSIKTEEVPIVLTVVDSGEVPYIRLMKSAVRFVALPTEPQNHLYIVYLMESSASVFPDLLEMIGLKAA